MRVGLIGTGAISYKHAQAYKNIGYRVTACTDINPEAGRKFAAEWGAEFVPTYEQVCRHPNVDYVDLCTFPDFRLEPLKICAEMGKHIQVQKPISTSVETAREMVAVAAKAGITLGVVSQHRFDDSSIFVAKAIQAGRLGKILQADAYVKWYRSPAYYSRPIKGSWDVEGGGALINQAVHQVDVLLWLIGPVKEVVGYWQLGALHKIQSEDVVCAMMRYANGAPASSRPRRPSGPATASASRSTEPRARPSSPATSSPPGMSRTIRVRRLRSSVKPCRAAPTRWRSRLLPSSASSWTSARPARPAASR